LENEVIRYNLCGDCMAILKEKTEILFKYSFESARQLDKIIVSCGSCNKEYSKLKRDLLNWSNNCSSCFGKKRGKELGDEFGKKQPLKGTCIDCHKSIHSNRKRCPSCATTYSSSRMMGHYNPMWTGNGVCDCGKRKSNSASYCRVCSIKKGMKSGPNNGRFISKNREIYLKNKKIQKTLSHMVNNVCRSLKIIKNKRKSKEILGYSWEEFKLNIESKFKDGMNWENRKDWHIDHIIPVSWFISNNLYDIEMVNSLNNLQPLWAKENLNKRDKVLEHEAIEFVNTFNFFKNKGK